MEKISTMKFAGKGELPIVDKKMTVMQEFVARMGREPVLGNGTEITQEIVHEVEKSFANLKPKSEEFDKKVRDYFVFLSGQLWSVLGAQERGEVIYLCSMYDGEVSSPDELKEKIISIAVGERRVVLKRGSRDFGQGGDYFWDSSDVEDLGDIKKQLDVLISLAVKHFEVDAEAFFRRTTG